MNFGGWFGGSNGFPAIPFDLNETRPDGKGPRYVAAVVDTVNGILWEPKRMEGPVAGLCPPSRSRLSLLASQQTKAAAPSEPETTHPVPATVPAANVETSAPTTAPKRRWPVQSQKKASKVPKPNVTLGQNENIQPKATEKKSEVADTVEAKPAPPNIPNTLESIATESAKEPLKSQNEPEAEFTETEKLPGNEPFQSSDSKNTSPDLGRPLTPNSPSKLKIAEDEDTSSQNEDETAESPKSAPPDARIQIKSEKKPVATKSKPKQSKKGSKAPKQELPVPPIDLPPIANPISFFPGNVFTLLKSLAPKMRKEVQINQVESCRKNDCAFILRKGIKTKTIKNVNALLLEHLISHIDQIPCWNCDWTGPWAEATQHLNSSHGINTLNAAQVLDKVHGSEVLSECFPRYFNVVSPPSPGPTKQVPIVAQEPATVERPETPPRLEIAEEQNEPAGAVVGMEGEESVFPDPDASAINESVIAGPSSVESEAQQQASEEEGSMFSTFVSLRDPTAEAVVSKKKKTGRKKRFKEPEDSPFNESSPLEPERFNSICVKAVELLAEKDNAENIAEVEEKKAYVKCQFPECVQALQCHKASIEKLEGHIFKHTTGEKLDCCRVLACPIQGCSFGDRRKGQMKKHIDSKHSDYELTSVLKASQRRDPRNRLQDELIAIFEKCFPDLMS